MTIPAELAARIERLYTVEHWRVGTIARQLNVHRDTVRRVLREHAVVPPGTPLRQSLVDPYCGFIRETLEKYPTLAASRLHDMVCERGYAGQASHFRHLVSTMRPRPPAEAFLRLRTLPGEQMQVDWAHFGHLQIGRARRPLMGFVMVLSYSRRVFLRFCLNAQMDSFLRGHVEAFIAFGGLARVLLYDNLKSVVLERVGDAIRFNPEFLAFAKHYRFEPQPVGIARGNEKGRVERHIDFIRKSFFAAREFADVDDLNAQARQWCEGRASDRPWPQDDALTVRPKPSLSNSPACSSCLRPAMPWASAWRSRWPRHPGTRRGIRANLISIMFQPHIGMDAGEGPRAGGPRVPANAACNRAATVRGCRRDSAACA